MKVSDAGLRRIENFEGGQGKDGRFHAYLDAVHVWTIGFGHTGPMVKAGQSISPQDAHALLLVDIAAREQAVTQLVRVPLTQNQFDALVSFVYNVGVAALTASTLLRKLNAGDYQGAASEFRRWVWGTDRKTGARTILKGLVIRRDAEATVFLTPD